MNSKPSKSALKREYLALQELGESLIGLAPEKLAALNLDEALENAIRTAAGIRSRGALRRQKQLIGKLMRRTDPAPIRAALAGMQENDRREKTLFRQVEAWRDRIADGSDADVTAFCDEIGEDCPEVRAAANRIRAAVSDRDATSAKRTLFRAIRKSLGRGMQPDRDNG